MPVAEFEEKEYEIAADIELARNPDKYGPRLFSSGQVLEKILGYDAAADPWAGHRIWIVLGVPRPPGIRLLPRLWHPGEEPKTGRLPRNPVSLILQYKRPSYLQGATAKQWHRWNRPYYRFERNGEQHRVLRRLERAVASNVIVRYVAPAFWQRTELERHQYRQTVLSSSGLVAPSVLGNHKVWTYERPGIVGYPNPSGRGRLFETLDALFTVTIDSEVGQQVVLADHFDEHLDTLASVALTNEPSLRNYLTTWNNSLQAQGIDLSSATIRRLVSYVAVQSLISQIGAVWYIGDYPA